MPDATRLIDAYLDGVISDADMAELDRLVVTDPAIADLCAARTVLHRQIIDHVEVDATAAASAPTTPRGAARRTPGVSRRTPILFATAAAFVLCAAAVAIYVFAVNPKSETRNPKSVPSLATVIDVSGDADLVVNRDLASPGSDTAPGTYAIESGSAELLLNNRVGIKLIGAATLTIHTNMAASLTRGSAEFRCPPGTEGYTVHLPGGAKAVDLGTRFRARVLPDDRPVVAVIEGRVRVDAADREAVELRAGQIAELDVEGRLLPLVTTFYDFDHLDAGDFPGIPLAGQDGWRAARDSRFTVRRDGDVFEASWLYGSDGLHEAWRIGGDGFIVAIPDNAAFTVEFDLLADHVRRGARIGLTDDEGRVLFQFGNNTPPQGASRWVVGDAKGSFTQSETVIPDGTAKVYHAVATIDPTAHDGDGALSLAVAPRGQTPVDVGDLQHVNLRLGDVHGSDLKGVYLRVFNGGGIDAIRITTPRPNSKTTPPTSEPADRSPASPAEEGQPREQEGQPVPNRLERTQK